MPTRDRPGRDERALTTSAGTEPSGDRSLHGPPHADERPLAAYELCSMPPLSSTKRHMAWTPAPLARRSSDAREPLLDAAVEAGQGAHLVGRFA